MDDERQFKQPEASPHTIKGAWLASLKLHFARKAHRSYLSSKQHNGPLLVQKMLYPEGDGVCHAVVLHPPGGVAGGDWLSLEVSLDETAHVLLTTPGAGKWYKANFKQAKQHLRFTLKNDACLEWMPQENIFFNGANVAFSGEIRLLGQACYAGWDITCFGRQAQNEQWNDGFFKQGLRVYRDDRLIWQDLASCSPQSRVLTSKIGLNGRGVMASFVVAAGQLPADVMQACREIVPDTRLDNEAKWGTTALPQMMVARYVGNSAQTARHYFEALWQILRPWYAEREVTRPRIWNT
jgi:urease accessory protein